MEKGMLVGMQIGFFAVYVGMEVLGWSSAGCLGSRVLLL